ncbi:MAG: ComF family protein [Congregibacter sp.]|nr:ComF family protein [Congregibacter sp.]
MLDYVAPQRCIYCDQPSYLPEALCGVCQDALCPNDDGCPHCALPNQSGALCPTCLTQPAPPVGITAAYVYDDAMAYFMQRWKYLGEQRLSLTAAKVMLKAPISFKNIDFLLPTPLHWQRQLRRGFNQSADLLHALASLDRSIALPPAKNIRISRSRRTDSQAKATRRERLKNLRGAFTVHGDVRGCTVGIVDDVCTTGATGNAMATALLEAGATRVHLYCLARTPAP